jgi:putative tryptophan/tyrosine transport system substrate-binding protein
MTTRRKILAGIAAALTLTPLAGHAQQPERMRRIGVLIGFSENDPVIQRMVSAFTNALERYGWVQGKNIRIDYRFAAGDPTLYKTYAAEIVGLMPDAILASPGTVVAALREQTRTIPIVFVLMPDPLGQGFVQSLARPGGNITGFSSYDAPLMGKWLQLLKEVAPSVTRVAVIVNPDTAFAPLPVFALLLNRAIEAAGPSIGMAVTLAAVHDDAAIEEAIAAEAREPGGGLISLPDSFNTRHRDVIVAAAARHGLPLIGTPDFPGAGALMSYMFDPADLHAQAASYIDRILKGASPVDLPVQQPTKYSLIINLKTAKALGLIVPQSMLARADEVIE